MTSSQARNPGNVAGSSQADLVSVVIPTARRAELVARAVRTVLAQTYTSLEVIVVIDGPDPATVAALAVIADPRLCVIPLGISRGGGGARNHGVSLARGEWIAFLDDDDEWLPDKLALQTSRATPAQTVMVTCLSYVITPGETYVWPRRTFDNEGPIANYLFDRRSLTRGDCHLQTSSFLLPRWLMLRVPFRDLPRHQDWDFVLRLFAEPGMRLETVAEPLVRYYFETARPSVGRGGAWRESLVWLDSMRDYVPRRAYSGFCATILMPRIAISGRRRDAVALIGAALRRGAPTFRHAILALTMLFVPVQARGRIRNFVLKFSRSAATRAVPSQEICL